MNENIKISSEIVREAENEVQGQLLKFNHDGTFYHILRSQRSNTLTLPLKNPNSATFIGMSDLPDAF